jgi:hypothetical protein
MLMLSTVVANSYGYAQDYAGAGRGAGYADSSVQDLTAMVAWTSSEI